MERPVIGRWKSPRSSEHRVFEELLSEHLDALFRTAVRLCRGHVADAEDLLQDASLRAFDGFGTLRDRAAARGWLFSILMRTQLNRLRARLRHPEDNAADMDISLATRQETLEGLQANDANKLSADEGDR